MITEEDVRAICLGLPGVEERASYGGRPSWRTPKRMFAWLREDPDALVVWVESAEEKLALVDSRPDVFSTTPHYEGQPIVLVSLEAVDRTEAQELLTESWELRRSAG